MVILSSPEIDLIHFTNKKKGSVNYCHVFHWKVMKDKGRMGKDDEKCSVARDVLTEKGTLWRETWKRWRSRLCICLGKGHWDTEKHQFKGCGAAECSGCLRSLDTSSAKQNDWVREWEELPGEETKASML